MSSQTTSHVLMIRPSAFGYNVETAANNVFQHIPLAGEDVIQSNAVREFDAFVSLLRSEGVDVEVIQDTVTPVKPDAIFPNNWVSFHDDATVVTYPMFSKMRRQERRDDVIHQLASRFRVDLSIQFESFEEGDKFLEGTGSMVLDRAHKVAYACISDRTDLVVFREWCERIGYRPVSFHAVSNGQPIYHTNVMMAIGTKIAVVCLDCLPDVKERLLLKASLAKHHHVVEITDAQVQSFAGNMLALQNQKGEELMVMSASALKSLTPEQKEAIEQYCRIVAAPIPTIEDVGGGSARCMIAEIFLPTKSK
ncbi:MAG: amidinotransferase [Saprospiraceae bacterium]|nr:amidinotransferase [Saprospiraceae bacterium]